MVPVLHAIRVLILWYSNNSNGKFCGIAPLQPRSEIRLLKQLNIEQAKQCIQLSEQLLELAQQQQWQHFEALLLQRDTLIMQIVAKDYPAEEANTVRALVGKLKALDAQIRPLAETAKLDALKALSADANQKKAASIYQKNQRRY
tara:strand:+ start:9590 stop:10024 length:435 start_codon:yes stop_codon:yes gene_type:complete